MSALVDCGLRDQIAVAHGPMKDAIADDDESGLRPGMQSKVGTSRNPFTEGSRLANSLINIQTSG